MSESSQQKFSLDENFLKRFRLIIELSGLNKSGFAKKIGVSPGFITDILKGRSRPAPKTIKAICSIFSVDENWLVAGRGQNPVMEVLMPVINPSRKIPVVSMANGGGGTGVMWEDAYPVGYGHKMVDCPTDLTDEKAFAVEVRGSSMSPRYDNGEVVYVSPSSTVVSGDYVVVKLINDEVLVKRIRFADNLIILESLNPNYEPIIVPREDVAFYYKITHSKGN